MAKSEKMASSADLDKLWTVVNRRESDVDKKLKEISQELVSIRNELKSLKTEQEKVVDAFVRKVETSSKSVMTELEKKITAVRDTALDNATALGAINKAVNQYVPTEMAKLARRIDKRKEEIKSLKGGVTKQADTLIKKTENLTKKTEDLAKKTEETRKIASTPLAPPSMTLEKLNRKN